MKLNPITLLLDIVAVYRLTRLVIEDKITEELRDWVFANTPYGSKWSYLITCSWCISIWAGAVVFGLRATNPALANYFSSVLAASAVTGQLSSRGF